MAEKTDRAFDLAAASRASDAYPCSARRPTVARMARIAMTTMSSQMVNQPVKRKGAIADVLVFICAFEELSLRK